MPNDMVGWTRSNSLKKSNQKSSMREYYILVGVNECHLTNTQLIIINTACNCHIVPEYEQVKNIYTKIVIFSLTK